MIVWLLSHPTVCGLLGHKRPLIEWYNGDGWARRCPRCGADL